MKIALLGAGGFIGSNIVENLLRSTNHYIMAYDMTFEKLKDIDLPKDRIELLQTWQGENEPLSIGLTVGLRDILDRADVVVDLIAYANPSKYVSNPLAVVQLNFYDNMAIVRYCAEKGKHLIQFSTCEVYGVSNGRESFDEDSQFIMGPVREHRWIYACAKQLLERCVHAYGMKGLPYTIVRPFNFIGPRIDYLPQPGEMGGPRVFSHFFAALQRNEPMYLVNGGAARRCYTYIHDAVEAFKFILKNLNGCRGAIINIGNPGNETSIKDLAYLMRELWHKTTGKRVTSPIESISGSEFYGEGYADCDRRIPDIKYISSLGWEPKYSLRSTVNKTLKWHLKHYRT